MNELFAPLHIVILLVVGITVPPLSFSVFAIPALWRIFRRTGASPALSLLALVPIANIVILYIVAFNKNDTTLQ
jgi:hypothetical protein